MPPTPNAIDVTNIANVKSWLNLTSTDQDQVIQDCVTAFSAYALRMTGRGPLDGSIPATSPLVVPVNYDDFYDGSGTMRQPIRNWPITAVAAVIVNGQTVPQSVNTNTNGWVVDGDKRFISLRGGVNPFAATFLNYRYQGYGPRVGPGFVAGIQNVEVQYTAGFAGTPFDLEMTARKIVALNYKRRSWIGQRSQAMAAGAGTVSYNVWEMDMQDRNVLDYYKRMTV